ncbi:crosslink repair DNA glycosylase YcaQ family protein [Mycolicibacterium helvum]|uniref:Uncharacterized protein n=1 Tax=Mycolicibacterium helvum TaxID=1534349 RepID=A0A7I7TC21_9MYCO|nr:crosslink repair DNA glycosylase YcaQ family protein [Mycolicibacterium helvum]BBY65696.1 hypothetical protein MHEL_39390 [Mycolicibacterium helvum]
MDNKPNISTQEFFLNSGSEQLLKIHQFARARYVAPWAVFFGVLLRVAASVPPHVQLPPVVGRPASLNLLCAFVGKSGAGKGNTTGVAREAWPTDVLELPIGSGQGIAAQFASDPDSAVIFDIPEIDILTGHAGQHGSILLATIKSFAMGEQIGQTNATRDARRIVDAHTYRGCLSVGTQPGHANVIFNDASGGLPQRFLWAPVVDPNTPGGKFPIPDPLVMDMPDWGTKGDVVKVAYGHPDIETTIVDTHLANVRGEGNPLDSHAILTRCKVAALLAIMHGSLEERGMARAIEKDGFDAGRLESVIRSILDQLRRNGEMPGSELRTSLTSENRKWFDQAIAQLAEDGRIVVTRAGSGFRYRLTDDRQGGDCRQGALTQVRGGGETRQGGGADSPISLENHSSREDQVKKMSCRAWVEGYLAELVKQGHTTADPVAVRDAGVAAGYNRNQLHNAGSTLGLTGAVWSLAA